MRTIDTVIQYDPQPYLDPVVRAHGKSLAYELGNDTYDYNWTNYSYTHLGFVADKKRHQLLMVAGAGFDALMRGLGLAAGSPKAVYYYALAFQSYAQAKMSHSHEKSTLMNILSKQLELLDAKIQNKHIADERDAALEPDDIAEIMLSTIKRCQTLMARGAHFSRVFHRATPHLFERIPDEVRPAEPAPANTRAFTV